MKKVVLHSMTDFVIEQDSIDYKELDLPPLTNEQIVIYIVIYLKALDRIIKYANFISQKTQIWMFVPCKLVDGEWVPMEEPKTCCSGRECGCMGLPYNYNSMEHLNEYDEAKERVLFEGFEYKCHREVFNSELGLTICFNTNSFQVDGSLGVGGGYFINNTVEFFTNMGMVLTPTAVKKIGL